MASTNEKPKKNKGTRLIIGKTYIATKTFYVYIKYGNPTVTL